MDNKQKKDQQVLNEIISPIFGHDYKNRVVAKNSKVEAISDDSSTTYLEKANEPVSSIFDFSFKSNFSTNDTNDTNVATVTEKTETINNISEVFDQFFTQG